MRDMHERPMGPDLPGLETRMFYMTGTELVLSGDGPLFRHTDPDTGLRLAESRISMTNPGISFGIADRLGIPVVDERPEQVA